MFFFHTFQENPDLHAVWTSGLFSLDTAMTLKSLAAQLEVAQYEDIKDMGGDLFKSGVDEIAAGELLKEQINDLIGENTMDLPSIFFSPALFSRR